MRDPLILSDRVKAIGRSNLSNYATSNFFWLDTCFQVPGSSGVIDGEHISPYESAHFSCAAALQRGHWNSHCSWRDGVLLLVGRKIKGNQC